MAVEADQEAYEVWCCFYFVLESFQKIVREHPSSGTAGMFEDRRRREENEDDLIGKVRHACRSRLMKDSAVESGRRRAAVTSLKEQQEVAVHSRFLDEIVTDPVIVKMIMDA